jgi:hypothetical protein
VVLQDELRGLTLRELHADVLGQHERGRAANFLVSL